MIYLIAEAEWRIYASLTWAIIASNNALPPVRPQAIICTNAVSLSAWALGKNIYIFIQKAFENVIWASVY